MHIALLVISPALGGGEGYILRLVYGLSAQGHKVVFVTGMISPIGDELEKYGIVVHRLNLGSKLSWRKKSLKDILLAPSYFLKMLTLLRRLKREGVQLLHVQYKKEQILGTLSSVMIGLPVVWTEHGPLQQQISSHWLLRTIYVAFARRLASKVMVVSNTTLLSLNQAGVPEEQLRLTRLGIDLVRFDRQHNPQPASDIIILSRPRIGIIGTLVKSKGQIEFLQAFSQLLPYYPSATAILIGDGPDRDVYMALVHKLGIESHVHFTGFREDTENILAALDVSVSASIGTGEGMPTRLLESMAMCVPVVATNVGGTSEIVINEKTGLLIDPGRSDALTHALLTILERTAFSKNMAEQAYAMVINSFSTQKMVAETIEVYSEVCNHR